MTVDSPAPAGSGHGRRTGSALDEGTAFRCLLNGRSCVTSKPCSAQSFELLVVLMIDADFSLQPGDPEFCGVVLPPVTTDLTEYCESYPLSALLNVLEGIGLEDGYSKHGVHSFAVGEEVVEDNCISE